MTRGGRVVTETIQAALRVEKIARPGMVGQVVIPVATFIGLRGREVAALTSGQRKEIRAVGLASSIGRSCHGKLVLNSMKP